MSDNLSGTEIFYGKTEEAEPVEPAATEVTEPVAEPEQEVKEGESADKEAVKTESESGELEAEADIQESYIELDGEEINLEDVKKWRDGHLMQSDYTKKTTAVAEERKELKSEREQLLKKETEVNEMKDQLKVLIGEDEAIDWVALKEDDPDEYIRLKERAEARKEALEKVKTESVPVNDPAMIATEQKKLFAALPEWIEDGKFTEAYKKDQQLITDYALKAGFNQEEFSQIVKSHHMVTILKAAKYDALQEKSKEISKKREKVPVIQRPKGKVDTEVKDAVSIMYG